MIRQQTAHLNPVMPVPLPPPTSLDVFPELSKQEIDAARTSSWRKIRSLKRASAPTVVLDLEELGEKEEFLEVSRQ